MCLYCDSNFRKLEDKGEEGHSEDSNHGDDSSSVLLVRDFSVPTHLGSQILSDLLALLASVSAGEFESDDIFTILGTTVGNTDTQFLETGLEDVLSVTSVLDSIIDDEFHNSVFSSSGILSSLDDVLTNSSLPVTVLLKSVTHGRSSLSGVGQGLLGQKVDRVLESGIRHTVGQTEFSLWLSVLEVLDSLLHGWETLLELSLPLLVGNLVLVHILDVDFVNLVSPLSWSFSDGIDSLQNIGNLDILGVELELLSASRTGGTRFGT
jgi:hypothetical protein